MISFFFPLARTSGLVLLCGLGFSIGSAHAAPAKGSPAKGSPAKGSPKAKTALKKISAPTKGLTLEGSGICSLQATFAPSSSNVSGAAFSSIGRTQGFGKRIVSSSTAQKHNGYSVVISFVGGRREGDQGPPRPERDVDRGRPESDEAREQRLNSPSSRFMLTFSSPTGFYAGQTIPIVLPVRRPKPPAQCFLEFGDVVRVEGREVTNGRGQRLRTGKNTPRTWVAASGTFKVESVNSERITFSLQNVRFVVPEFGKEKNAARGAFVLQGAGQCTFNEVD